MASISSSTSATPASTAAQHPEEALQPFLLIEAPRLLFPFARQVVAEAISNTGFPPLLLDPIDFGSAYLEQLEAQGGGEAARRREPPSETSGEA